MKTWSTYCFPSYSSGPLTHTPTAPAASESSVSLMMSALVALNVPWFVSISHVLAAILLLARSSAASWSVFFAESAGEPASLPPPLDPPLPDCDERESHPAMRSKGRSNRTASARRMNVTLAGCLAIAMHSNAALRRGTGGGAGVDGFVDGAAKGAGLEPFLTSHDDAVAVDHVGAVGRGAQTFGGLVVDRIEQDRRGDLELVARRVGQRLARVDGLGLLDLNPLVLVALDLPLAQRVRLFAVDDVELSAHAVVAL